MARRKKIPPLHPGEVLREDFVIPTGISIKGQRAVSADTALRLARYLGTSPEFWLGLQSDYELEKAKEELAAKIEREVRPRERAA